MATMGVHVVVYTVHVVIDLGLKMSLSPLQAWIEGKWLLMLCTQTWVVHIALALEKML
jgi:hypothetical protein